MNDFEHRSCREQQGLLVAEERGEIDDVIHDEGRLFMDLSVQEHINRREWKIRTRRVTATVTSRLVLHLLSGLWLDTWFSTRSRW
jgi:hypothetical protein